MSGYEKNILLNGNVEFRMVGIERETFCIALVHPLKVQEPDQVKLLARPVLARPATGPEVRFSTNDNCLISVYEQNILLNCNVEFRMVGKERETFCIAPGSTF